MSTVVIDYGQLDKLCSDLATTCDRLQNYGNELSKKVSGKFSELKGGSSSNTNNSKYYVDKKIKDINKKREDVKKFRNSVIKFSDFAERTDKSVAKKIENRQDAFVKKNSYLKPTWASKFQNWLIDLKNSCPLFEVIGDAIAKALDNLSDLWGEIKYWYKHNGGKEWLEIAFNIAGAIVAVIFAIAACAPPIAGIVAVCAAISAVIAAVNAITNLVNSVRAKNARDNGNLLWSKVYQDQDTVQDTLRQTNWGNGFLNGLSYAAATYVDAVQTVCDAVAIWDGVKNIKETYKQIKKKTTSRSFKKGIKCYILEMKRKCNSPKDFRTYVNEAVKSARRGRGRPRKLSKLKIFMNKITPGATKTKHIINTVSGIKDALFEGGDIKIRIKSNGQKGIDDLHIVKVTKSSYNFVTKDLKTLGNDFKNLAKIF